MRIDSGPERISRYVRTVVSPVQRPARNLRRIDIVKYVQQQSLIHLMPKLLQSSSPYGNIRIE